MSRRRRFIKPTSDRNFDDIADRFSESIYGNVKGKIRLEVLKRDFAEFGIESTRSGALDILDAGGGNGQFSCDLSKNGHRIVLADPSSEMLRKARVYYNETSPLAEVEFLHADVQSLPEAYTEKFDLILFHAVLEWLVKPKETLEYLLTFLKPGGVLSLLFYNRQGLVMRHLSLGNFHFVEKGYLSGVGDKSLTPISPQVPSEVKGWFEKLDYECLCYSGVRCFSDLIDSQEKGKLSDEAILRLELIHSRLDPYREIARYIHGMWRKPS